LGAWYVDVGGLFTIDESICVFVFVGWKAVACGVKVGAETFCYIVEEGAGNVCYCGCTVGTKLVFVGCNWFDVCII